MVNSGSAIVWGVWRHLERIFAFSIPAYYLFPGRRMWRGLLDGRSNGLA
jgi:hypothetical protein